MVTKDQLGALFFSLLKQPPPPDGMWTKAGGNKVEQRTEVGEGMYCTSAWSHQVELHLGMFPLPATTPSFPPSSFPPSVSHSVINFPCSFLQLRTFSGHLLMLQSFSSAPQLLLLTCITSPFLCSASKGVEEPGSIVLRMQW